MYIHTYISVFLHSYDTDFDRVGVQRTDMLSALLPLRAQGCRQIARCLESGL